MVTATVMPGTLNVVRVIIMPRFQHKGGGDIVHVGDYLFVPGMTPEFFKIMIDISLNAAGKAAAGFMKGGKQIGVNPSAALSVIDLVIEAVKRKVAGAILSPDGKTKSISGVEKNGVIKGDITEFLNLKVNGSGGVVDPGGEVMPTDEGIPDEEPGSEQEPPARTLQLDF